MPNVRLSRVRLLLHASETDQEHRYYNKTLEEVDRLSLVRDRTGPQHDDARDQEGAGEDDAEEDEEAEEDGYGDQTNEGPVSARHDMAPSTKTRQQLDLEDEWGLTRSPARSDDYVSDDGFVERDGGRSVADHDDDEFSVRSCSLAVKGR